MNILNDQMKSVRKGVTFFNLFMWSYQVTISCICFFYKIYFLLFVLIFNFCLSNINWIAIKKEKYLKAVSTIYFELILFMAAGTVSLGMNYGFYLYGISMITVLFYTNYMCEILKNGQVKEKAVITAILVSYVSSFLHSIIYGPIYSTSDTMSYLFFAGNSAMVFGVLIIYMKLYINTIRNTEQMLEKTANCDKLTGLFNRHYILSYMDSLTEKDLASYSIAILDIDNFKKVNDTYGHNAGDFILKSVADIARDFFSECTVCRWGGEEFVILGPMDTVSETKLDDMRKKIAETVLDYNDNRINVTVTIGTERYSEGIDTDKWISIADEKLYTGKTCGKNKVVS